jgi:hypothetical protein
MPTKKVAKKATNKKPAGAASLNRGQQAHAARMMAQAITEMTGMPVVIGKGKTSGSNYRTTNPRGRR